MECTNKLLGIHENFELEDLSEVTIRLSRAFINDVSTPRNVKYTNTAQVSPTAPK